MDLQLCNVYTSVAKPAAGKVIYLGFLLIGSLLSLLVFTPGVRTFFIRHGQLCERTLSHEKCEMLVGHALLYRLYIGMFFFFMLLAIVNCQMSLFSAYTSIIENGLWFLKWNLFCFLLLISLLIPEGEICNTVMHTGWFAAMVVRLIEIVLIIDFAKYINIYLVEKIQKSEQNSKCFYLILTLTTASVYTLSLGFMVYFLISYSSQNNCQFHWLFLVLIIILCIIAMLLSAHPHFTEAGLLESGIVTLYVIYLAWSAMMHSPDINCHHSNLQFNQEDSKDIFTLSIKPAMIFELMLIFSLIFYGICRVDDFDRFLTHLYLRNCCRGYEEDEEERMQPNEHALLSSSYLSFYMCLLVVILYILMVVSDYYTPEGILGTEKAILETPDGIVDMNEYTKQFSKLMAMSINMTSSLLMILMYMWTVVAPLIVPH